MRTAKVIMFRVIAAGTQVNTDIRNDGKIFVSSSLTITTKNNVIFASITSMRLTPHLWRNSLFEKL